MPGLSALLCGSMSCFEFALGKPSHAKSIIGWLCGGTKEVCQDRAARRSHDSLFPATHAVPRRIKHGYLIVPLIVVMLFLFQRAEAVTYPPLVSAAPVGYPVIGVFYDNNSACARSVEVYAYLALYGVAGWELYPRPLGYIGSSPRLSPFVIDCYLVPVQGQIPQGQLCFNIGNILP